MIAIPFFATPGTRPFPEDRPLHAVADAISDGTIERLGRAADPDPNPILFVRHRGPITLAGAVVDAEQSKSQGILLHPDRVSDRDLAVNAVLGNLEVCVDQLGHLERRVGPHVERDVERLDRPAGITARRGTAVNPLPMNATNRQVQTGNRCVNE